MVPLATSWYSLHCIFLLGNLQKHTNMSFDGPQNHRIPKPTVSLSTSSGDSVTLGSLLLFPSCCRWCRIQGPKNGPRSLEMVVLYYPRHITFGRLVQIDKCFSNASTFEMRFILLQIWSFPGLVYPVKPYLKNSSCSSTMNREANIFRQSFCINCTSILRYVYAVYGNGMTWICDRILAASLLLSQPL